MTAATAADAAFASSVTELGQFEERPCQDPECSGTAEPEQDGDHRYWACLECGFEFGWDRVQQQTMAVAEDGSCSVGVPAEVRKAVSGITERAQAQIARDQQEPVPLGLSIGKRPGL